MPNRPSIWECRGPAGRCHTAVTSILSAIFSDMRSMRLHTRIIVTIGLVVFIPFYAFAATGAHATAAPQTTTSTNFHNLFLPFQNFFRSIGSIGNTNVLPAIRSSVPASNFFTTSAWDAFSAFDNWLYGIAGFHISNFLTMILGVLSWVLNYAKGIVDWLLGFLSGQG